MKLVGLIGGAIWQYGTHNFQVTSRGAQGYAVEIWHLGRTVQVLRLRDLETVTRFIRDYIDTL